MAKNRLVMLNFFIAFGILSLILLFVIIYTKTTLIIERPVSDSSASSETTINNSVGDWKLVTLITPDNVVVPVKDAEPILSFHTPQTGVLNLDCARKMPFLPGAEDTQSITFSTGADTYAKICESALSMELAQTQFYPATDSVAEFSIKNERLFLEFSEKNTVFIFKRI